MHYSLLHQSARTRLDFLKAGMWHNSLVLAERNSIDFKEVCEWKLFAADDSYGWAVLRIGRIM